jgi:hypothetical protein
MAEDGISNIFEPIFRSDKGRTCHLRYHDLIRVNQPGSAIDY